MVSHNFVEIQMGGGDGGGVFELGNPEWRAGGSSSFGNPGGWGGQKTVSSILGVWIFSRITQFCNRKMGFK